MDTVASIAVLYFRMLFGIAQEIKNDLIVFRDELQPATNEKL